MSEECECEFAVSAGSDEEPSWHFERKCEYCQHVWYGLHCPHDEYQNPCPKCDKRPTVVFDKEILVPDSYQLKMEHRGWFTYDKIDEIRWYWWWDEDPDSPRCQ